MAHIRYHDGKHEAAPQVLTQNKLKVEKKQSTDKHLSAQTHTLTHTRPPKGCEGCAMELSTGGQEPRLPVPAHRENLVFNRNSSIKTKVGKKKKKTVGRQDSTALAITAGVIYPITTTLNSPKQRNFCFLFGLKTLGQQGPHTHTCPAAGVTSMFPQIT